MTGYFYVARGLFEHPAFLSKEPYTAREAWLWLIERANYAESKFRHNSQIHTIPRGSYASSYRSLATEWRWSPNRVIRELKMWQSEQMVDLETERGFLCIRVCNYDRYQQPWNTDGIPTEQERDRDGTLTDTNQIKESKGRKETKNPPAPPLPDWVDPALWGAFREMRKGQKKPMTAEAERLVLRELARLKGQGHDPTAVLEQSIRKTWQDVYPVKGDRNENTSRYDGNNAGNPRQQGGAGKQSKWQHAAAGVLEKIQRGEL